MTTEAPGDAQITGANLAVEDAGKRGTDRSLVGDNTRVTPANDPISTVTNGRTQVQIMMVPVVFMVLPITVLFAIYPGFSFLNFSM